MAIVCKVRLSVGPAFNASVQKVQWIVLAYPVVIGALIVIVKTLSWQLRRRKREQRWTR